MRFLFRLVLFLAVALVIGCAVFLASWDIPPPTRLMEIVIPDERFAP